MIFGGCFKGCFWKQGHGGGVFGIMVYSWYVLTGFDWLDQRSVTCLVSLLIGDLFGITLSMKSSNIHTPPSKQHNRSNPS